MSSAQDLAAARKVADAVLYEGYVLYPYRASAQKNQMRWQFGVVAPGRYSRETGTDPSRIATECLFETRSGAEAKVGVILRFLQVQERRVHGPGGEEVGSVEVGSRRWVNWDEAVEHEISFGPFAIADLSAGVLGAPVAVEGGEEAEPLVDSDAGVEVGKIVRRRWPLEAHIGISASEVPGPFSIWRLGVDVENVLAWGHKATPREEAMRHSMVAAHVMLEADGAVFLSSIDPPEFAKDLAGECSNAGLFPVLACPDDTLMLAGPIILYDHPEVAPESEGDYFDATEIDEILTLRTLTLTEDEKREARATDARSAEIIERCDNMPPEVFERLHGAIRSLRAESIGTDDADPITDTTQVGGATVGRGTKVVLRPSRRADAQDLFLSGKEATVTGVFRDLDGETHLAVVVDDDPAAELHDWYGRYLYFRTDEVEVGL